MRKLHLLFLILISNPVKSQNLLNQLESLEIKHDSLRKKYILVSDTQLNLEKITIRISNPFDSLPYSISHSVIYNDNVISLLEPGYFFCLDIKTLKRNKQLEKRLNKVKYEKFLLIGDSIICLAKKLSTSKEKSKDYWQIMESIQNAQVVGEPVKSKWLTYNVFSKARWMKKKLKLPRLRKKIFEDEDIYVFNQDHGEWGASTHIYFKNKKDPVILGKNSVCAFAKDSNIYAYSKTFNDEGAFWRLNLFKKDKVTIDDFNREIDSDSLDFSGINICGVLAKSVFNWRSKVFSLIDYNGKTVLAELNDHKVLIKDFLFEAHITSYDNSTYSDGTNVLINFDTYVPKGIDYYKESQYLLLKEDKVIRVIWE